MCEGNSCKANKALDLTKADLPIADLMMKESWNTKSFTPEDVINRHNLDAMDACKVVLKLRNLGMLKKAE